MISCSGRLEHRGPMIHFLIELLLTLLGTLVATQIFACVVGVVGAVVQEVAKAMAVGLLVVGSMAVLALVAFLAYRNRIELATIFSQPPRMLPAISALVIALFAYLLAALRWQLLLQAQDIRIPFQRIVSWTGVGHLCTYVSIGQSGGDIAKAICIARVERPRRRMLGDTKLTP